MKRLIAAVLITVVAIAGLSSVSKTEAAGAAAISVALDGVSLSFTDAKPFADAQKRVLVPLRFVSEKLGTTVDYQEASGSVAIKSGNLDIKLVLGSQKATVNGVEKDLGTQPVLKNSRAYVPLRFVSEALGRRVVWDGANSTAHIWNLISDKELEKQTTIDWTASGVSMPAHVAYYHFIAKEGALTFSDPYWDGPDGPFTGYKISEKLTPNLSKKAYQMVKYLADNEQYTDAHYWARTSDGGQTTLMVTYAKKALAVDNDNYYFRYMFMENQKLTSFASKNVSMRLVVSSLFWSGEDRNIKVENKLRMSLVALFGDTQGIAMYNWIMSFYNKTLVANSEYEELKATKVSKTFGNTQIDFDGTGMQILTFNFTNKG